MKEGKFVGSTSKELVAIHKRAQAKDEERDKLKGAKTVRGGMRTNDPEALSEALRKNLPVRVYQDRLFSLFEEYARENKGVLPAYRAYEKDVQAANTGFMYEIQLATARMSWQQLSKLLGEGTGVPVPVRDWSDAFHHVMSILMQTLGCTDYLSGGKCELDKKALANWPFDPKQRRTKEELKMSNREIEERKKLLAAAEDDEEEEEEEETKDGEDEEEEEEEEEEEAPPKKKGGFGKKGKTPSTTKEKAVKTKPVKAKEKPAKEKPAKAEKAEKAPAAKLADGSTIKSTGKVRTKGGPKGELLKLVPKKGVTLKALTAAAHAQSLPTAKVKKWVSFLASYGFLSIHA